MFGIQWDLVLKFLETKGVAVTELKSDSSSWGNYRNVEFPVAQGNKYTIATNFALGNWDNVPENYIKPTFDTDDTNGNGILLSTGATERNSKMNIYDLAGNVWEWTLEKNTNADNSVVFRGGAFGYVGLLNQASYRNRYSTSSGTDIGFRLALY